MDHEEATVTAGTAFGGDVYQQTEAYLRQERERIYAEIHAYPPPIPACDAQFNYLIEKRGFVSQELNRVRSLARDAQPDSQKRQSLREYVIASQILDRVAKAEILIALDNTTQPEGMRRRDRNGFLST